MKKLICLCLSLLLVACSGCYSTVIDRREAPAFSLTTASWFQNSNAAAAYQELSATFSDRYGVTIVDSSTLTGSAYTGKIINDFAAGSEPDVFYFPVDMAQSMIASGQVVSVEEIRREYPSFASGLNSTFFERTADASGAHWCVPVLASYQALFCNRALFDRLGVAYPTSWGELMVAIDTFRSYGITPIASGFRDNPSIWMDHLILAHGVAQHGEAPASRGEVPHTWTQALSCLPRLREKRAFFGTEASMTQQEALELFASQKAAMILDSSDSVPELGDPEDFIAINFPCRPPSVGEEHLIVDCGYGYFISRKAWENGALRDAAVQFVSYMLSPEAMGLMLRSNAGYPTLARDKLTAVYVNTPLSQSILELCLSSQLHTSLEDRVGERPWSILCSMLPSLYQGTASVSRALDEFTKSNK